jgi:hypothetical protein
MAEFERIVTVKPAYDCLMVQPCVHGSTDCGTRPGASHGRHNAELHMKLSGPAGEVILTVGTGWELPVTPRSVRIGNIIDVPRGSFVEFHSPTPQYEGHEPQSTRCDLWPVCYGNMGYSMADEPTALLVSSGSDAVWTWLENAYRDTFETSGNSIAGGA